MINNHFVPQLLLRHFCKEEKLQYYNKKTDKTEVRSTKSVFSEKGYYPDKLENDLCHKIETQYANVLNKNILSENYRISLTSADMLILKKFLIITILRVHDENMEHNAWYQVLKKDGFIPEEEVDKNFFGGDFFENINKILECGDIVDLLKIAHKGENLNLFNFVKDIVYSYNVFVKTNNCKEDFVITDRGWAEYRGPMSVKKMNAMLNMLEKKPDPYIDMLLHVSSPQDYAVFPVSSDMAIIAVNPAFKMCMPEAPYNIIYPDTAPTLSQCLGFGTAETIAPPDNKILRNGIKEYRYKIQQLSRNDVTFLNSLLIKNADEFIGYADRERVKKSFESCEIECQVII